MQQVVDFIASRKKKWAIIYFHGAGMMSTAPISAIKSVFDRYNAEDLNNLVAFITLYMGRMARLISGINRWCKGTTNIT